jgi:hypothetical protein
MCGPKNVETTDGSKKCHNIYMMGWARKKLSGYKFSIGKFGSCRLFHFIERRFSTLSDCVT